MYKSLYEEFMRLKGQPVRIYTDDGRSVTGIVLNVYPDAVRILDKCIMLIEFRHIDAVVEPQMDLEKCCKHDKCDDDDDDDDNGNGRPGSGEYDDDFYTSEGEYEENGRYENGRDKDGKKKRD